MTTEWLTPAPIIGAARQAMGGIDLDPASCEEANKVVQAGAFYTIADNGLRNPWFGRVWLNPPYSRGVIDDFLMRVSIERFRVDQTVLLINIDATEATKPIREDCQALCLLERRVQFRRPDGSDNGTPPRPSAVFYFGEREHLFKRAFEPLGPVFVRDGPYSDISIRAAMRGFRRNRRNSSKPTGDTH